MIGKSENYWWSKAKYFSCFKWRIKIIKTCVFLGINRPFYLSENFIKLKQQKGMNSIQEQKKNYNRGKITTYIIIEINRDTNSRSENINYKSESKWVKFPS